LRPEGLDGLVRAGINDWGGVSPVTPDHVNPEAPWPHLKDLMRATDVAGPEAWTDPSITPRVRRFSDSRGFARPDRWYAGLGCELPPIVSRWTSAAHGRTEPAATPPQTEVPCVGPPQAAAALQRGDRAAELKAIIGAASAGHALSEAHIVRLFSVEGRDLDEVIAAADRL